MNTTIELLEDLIHADSSILDIIKSTDLSTESAKEKRLKALEDKVNKRLLTIRDLYSSQLRNTGNQLRSNKESLEELVELLEKGEVKVKTGVINDEKLASMLFTDSGTISEGLSLFSNEASKMLVSQTRNNLANILRTATFSNAADLFNICNNIIHGCTAAMNTTEVFNKGNFTYHTTTPFIGGTRLGFSTQKTSYNTEGVSSWSLLGYDYERASSDYIVRPTKKVLLEEIVDVIKIHDTIIELINTNSTRELVFGNIEKVMPNSAITGEPLSLDEGRVLVSKEVGEIHGMTDKERYEIGLLLSRVRTIPFAATYNVSLITDKLQAFTRYAKACTAVNK